MKWMKKAKHNVVRNIRSKLFYQNDWDKECFQHDIAHVGFKDLTIGTLSNKVLGDKAFKTEN